MRRTSPIRVENGSAQAAGLSFQKKLKSSRQMRELLTGERQEMVAAAAETERPTMAMPGLQEDDDGYLYCLS